MTFDVKERHRIMSELDIEAFKKLMLAQEGWLPSNDQICLAAMHKARCYMQTKVISVQEKLDSVQWLNNNGFEVPKDIET